MRHTIPSQAAGLSFNMVPFAFEERSCPESSRLSLVKGGEWRLYSPHVLWRILDGAPAGVASMPGWPAAQRIPRCATFGNFSSRAC